MSTHVPSAPPAGENPADKPRDKPDVIDALLMLGQLCLDRGEPAQARQWFHNAARGGDARALNMLGRCHELGWGGDPAPETAAAYYRKAADLGDAWAMFNLADLYFRGHGVPRNDEASYQLYAAAARKGHVKALNMLGRLHESGRGIPRNDAYARAYFQAAAEGGDCWGQFNHARMLLLAGALDQALVWLDRALNTGFPDFYRAMDEALHGHPDSQVQAMARRARTLAQPGTLYRQEASP